MASLLLPAGFRYHSAFTYTTALHLIFSTHTRSGHSGATSRRVIAARIAVLALLALALALGGCRKDRNELENISAEELYQRGKERMDNAAWDTAIAAYKALQTRYPFGRYTEQSMLDLSYCYFKRGAREEALSTLDRFIRTYPAHPSVDYAYYLKGLVCEVTDL